MHKHWATTAHKVKRRRNRQRALQRAEAIWSVIFGLMIATGLILLAISTPNQGIAATSITEIVQTWDQPQYDWFLSQFPEQQALLVGCYSMSHNTIFKPFNGTCAWVMRAQAIWLPPRSHIKVWLEFWTPEQIVNRLALVNYESAFRENAWNRYAYWYVQTLRKYGIQPDIRSQLEWLHKRGQVILSKEINGSKRCGIYWEQDNTVDWYKVGMYAVLACYYRYHYHASKWSWYAKRGVETTKFYRGILKFNK